MPLIQKFIKASYLGRDKKQRHREIEKRIDKKTLILDPYTLFYIL